MQTDALLAPGILNWATHGYRQADLFRHAVHGEVADKDHFATAFFRFLRGEADGGIFFNIKEGGAAEVFIAGGYTGINALGLDLAFGALDFFAIDSNRAGEFVELAVDRADDHVLDGEADGGMGRVDIVRVGSFGRNE